MAPDPPGIPSANRRRPATVEPQGQPTTVRIERGDEAPVSTGNPWSAFPVAEAAKAKVSVSVLLLLGVAAITYWVGSTRHAEQMAALKAEVAAMKVTSESCAKATRVEELMTNLAREQATTGGRVQQMNGDVAVIYSHITGAQRRAATVSDARPAVE